MIASWMLYAILVSALVCIAAVALDHVAAARRWPMRAVWFGALFLSVAWPLGSVARRLMPTPVSAVRVLPFTITVQSERLIARAATSQITARMIDRSLIAVWCTLSVLLLLRLSQGVLILQRTRGGWKRRRVDGVTVRVSENVGPAVVGLRSMDVVLPEWILNLDAPLRAIVLRHEEEHRTARDPYLLFAAALAVALMPWNLALWIQARRLRLAIELDCDARVLRAHPSPERYGLLMLTIAQRRSIAPTLFAPMLSEPATQLERRILAMRNTTQRVAQATVYGGLAVAVAVLAIAGSLQAADGNSAAPITKRLLPTLSVPIAEMPASLTRTVTLIPNAATPSLGHTTPMQQHLELQQGNPGPRYPDILRSAEVEGTVVVEFTTDASGAADSASIRVITSTHDLFTAAVRAAVAKWHLQANVTAHVPFAFVIQRAGGENMMQKRIVIDGVDAIKIVGVQAEDAAPASPERITAIAAQRAAQVVVGSPLLPTPVTDNQTYFEFQVEKQVSPRPTNIGPRYPDSLRTAHVEGEVLAQFVVDTLGRPDMSTFKVLKSTHEMFTNAVKSTLPTMLFYPADVGGKHVKQLVQMPFQFNLSK